jgi:hypothetical protein
VKFNPYERLTLLKIKEHPFLNGLDYMTKPYDLLQFLAGDKALYKAAQEIMTGRKAQANLK